MRVTFVLPGASLVPSGGARMVFRYANALAESGWRATVIMPASLREAPLWRRLARQCRYWGWRVTGGYSPRSWMKLHPEVLIRWVPDLRSIRVPDGEAVVATAVQTAEAVARWPVAAGLKFYFVQGYETWDFPVSRVESSWRLPLRKIAISRWLCDLISGVGESVAYLPNGLDHEVFGLDQPTEARTAPVVLWPYHRLPQKGSADALAALRELRSEMPELELYAYGVSPAPFDHGLRIRYVRNPSQAALRRLYNQAMVMVAPSHSEGWGLPACEALQCGCALAASDVGGHREFLRHGHNALLHVPGDVAVLRENVRRLLVDEPLRLRLAKQGVADMAALRIEAAVDHLKRILRGEERG